MYKKSKFTFDVVPLKLLTVNKAHAKNMFWIKEACSAISLIEYKNKNIVIHFKNSHLLSSFQKEMWIENNTRVWNQQSRPALGLLTTMKEKKN